MTKREQRRKALDVGFILDNLVCIIKFLQLVGEKCVY
jgi:hypothetical protein